MAHVFQVGAGSGGMPVLDMLVRDPRVRTVTLVEPDVYKPHNVERHLFGLSAIGQKKAELARQWILERRPEVEVRLLVCDLMEPAREAEIGGAVQACDVGVCAADNEKAKYHFDELMRRYRKPWTLGEVLSGGIGGFVHSFVVEGPCYGCVASHLQRTVQTDTSPRPDYSAPGGPIHEVTIPASIGSIHAIASLHALATLDLLDPDHQPAWTSLLLSLKRVPGMFEEAVRPYRFRIPRAAGCLICQATPMPASPEDLDVALDQALARLRNE